jgi:hypothetical protein
MAGKFQPSPPAGTALDLTNLDGSLIFYQSLPANPPRSQFYRTTSP